MTNFASFFVSMQRSRVINKTFCKLCLNKFIKKSQVFPMLFLDGVNSIYKTFYFIISNFIEFFSTQWWLQVKTNSVMQVAIKGCAPLF